MAPVGKVSHTAGQPDTDFGRGVYTTTLRRQAEDYDMVSGPVAAFWQQRSAMLEAAACGTGKITCDGGINGVTRTGVRK